MGRGLEAECLLRLCIRGIGDVEVKEVDPPLVLLLEPVDHGRHGLAAQSAGVKELHELRSPRLREQCHVARVVPHAVLWCVDPWLPGLSGLASGNKQRNGQCGDYYGSNSSRSSGAFHESSEAAWVWRRRNHRRAMTSGTLQGSAHASNATIDAPLIESPRHPPVATNDASPATVTVAMTIHTPGRRGAQCSRCVGTSDSERERWSLSSERAELFPSARACDAERYVRAARRDLKRERQMATAPPLVLDEANRIAETVSW